MALDLTPAWRGKQMPIVSFYKSQAYRLHTMHAGFELCIHHMAHIRLHHTFITRQNDRMFEARKVHIMFHELEQFTSDGAFNAQLGRSHRLQDVQTWPVRLRLAEAHHLSVMSGLWCRELIAERIIWTKHTIERHLYLRWLALLLRKHFIRAPDIHK